MKKIPITIARALDPKRLRLTILPTEKCNLRCHYCYEDFAIGRMPESVVQGIERLIARRAPTLQELGIVWFGGEPLLAKQHILRIAKHTQALANQYGFRYISGITTNAIQLDGETLHALVMQGIKQFQVTLDGPETSHDQVRIKPDGSGTFKTIMTNLQTIKASSYDVAISLRLHFTPSTLQEVLLFTEELNDTLLDDSRFTLTPYSIGRWGGDNDADVPLFKNEHDEVDAKQKILERVRQPERSVSVPSESVCCYAAKANAFIIRSNGLVSKCTVALSHDRNLIGRITPAGELELDAQKTVEWSQGLSTGNASQLACPAKHVLSTAHSRI